MTKNKSYEKAWNKASEEAAKDTASEVGQQKAVVADSYAPDDGQDFIPAALRNPNKPSKSKSK